MVARLGYDEVIATLETMADPAGVAGLARYGIDVQTVKSFGISAPRLHELARRIGRDHALAEIGRAHV